MGDQELCPALVRKNLVLVELGKDLTVPLARLQRNCKFKKEWEKIQSKWHGDTKDAIIRKARMREYSQRPDIKARRKAQRREYYQRPDVKARRKAQMREYYQRNKKKIVEGG